MGGKAQGKGKSKGKNAGATLALSNGSSGGASGSSAAATREITEQLKSQGGKGNVWIQGWGHRYQAQLGSLRDFLESQPAKFKMIPGEGAKFSVALAGAGGSREKGKGRSKPKEIAEDDDPLNLGPAAKAANDEILESLREQGGSGNVWIQQWGTRYEPWLGTLRDFLESQPAKYTVIPGDGRKYSVQLAKGGKRKRQESSAAVEEPVAKRSKGGSKGGTAGGKGGGGKSLVGEAVRAVKEQLSAPGNDGRVWVPQWGQRFQESLGTLRDFLESKPDKFTVIPGEGRKFTVALA